MARKKIFRWLILIFVIIFLYNSFTSSAADIDYTVEYFEYKGELYPYTKTNQIVFYNSNGYEFTITFDKEVYCFASKFTWNGFSSSTICYFSHEPFSFINTYLSSDIYECNTSNSIYSNVYGGSFSLTPYSINIPYFVDPDGSLINNGWLPYFSGDTFVPIKSPIPVNTSGIVYEKSFSLLNPQASVTDGVLSASWQYIDFVPARGSVESMPLLLDLYITDLDTNVREMYSYPVKSSLPDANRLTFYDVTDCSLNLSLAQIDDLPTNFRVDSVHLTPYISVRMDYLDLVQTYKGQSSMIYLNYSGQFNGVVQVLPDTPFVPEPEPEDSGWGIFGLLSNFFSGFFSDFGAMLKNLFIPSSSDMQLLLEDMQVFFSEKFGFLWYPFDQAIQIVDAFSSGTADSEFQVPACTLNLGPGIGTVTMWHEQSIDLDPIGIAQYVRFFTSAIICCSVAMLAWKKFDEVFKGASVT